jgi:dGTPase
MWGDTSGKYCREERFPYKDATGLQLERDGHDQRSSFRHDRDRIIYSSAFRRLAGITQVFSADHLAPIHDRFSHSIKVAQLGRSLAEHLLTGGAAKLDADEQTIVAQSPAMVTETLRLASHFGLSVDVVEAACYAHDLGHPPFGHIGEHALDRLIKNDEPCGYEGNAQAFRILTKLALRNLEIDGLDLSRAVLAGTLKYPYPRTIGQRIAGTEHPKFGYYMSEKAEFDFAHKWHQDGGWDLAQTIEAAIMDFADDIAYSVHDIEDCHRMNMIPWQDFHIINRSSPGPTLAPEQMVNDYAFRCADPDKIRKFKEAGGRIITIISAYGEVHGQRYVGSRPQRIALRRMGSKLIKRFILGSDLHLALRDKNGVVDLRMSEDVKYEIAFLKQITRTYVFENASLGAQQRGQQRVVDEVFADLCDDIDKCMTTGKAPKIVPQRLLYLVHDRGPQLRTEGNNPKRATGDCIASMTEAELLALHGRLRGVKNGNVFDPIIV